MVGRVHVCLFLPIFSILVLDYAQCHHCVRICHIGNEGFGWLDILEGEEWDWDLVK